jgi:DNA polymerase I-like protein with 3'-5' exonuclease and polymerase domains
MAGEAAVILKETMIEAWQTYVSKVPIDVDVTIGDTWVEK